MTNRPDAAAHQADEACHGGLDGLWATLDVEVWEPLRTALGEARLAHGQAVVAAGLTGDCPEDISDVRARAAVYLSQVATAVQPMLRDVVEARLPARSINQCIDKARGGSRGACAGLPRAVEVEGGLGPAGPHDSLARRLGRGIAWVGDGARTVDVRAVALRHRARCVVGLEEQIRIEALHAWSLWLGRLESGCATWATPVLTNLVAETGEGDDPGVHWQALVSATTALDSELEALAAHCPHGALADSAMERLARARAQLESDLSVAGTFLLSAGAPEERTPESEDAENWSKWQAQACARLSMQSALLAVFTGVRRARTDMLDRLRGEFAQAWDDRTAEGAVALRVVAESLQKKRPSTPDDFDAAKSEAKVVLEGLRGACPTSQELVATGRRIAGMAVGAVQASLHSVPRVVVLHPLPSAGRPLRRPPGVTHTVELQEMARQAFDSLRMERIRTAPAALVETAEGLGNALSEVGDIVMFGFDAAATELEGEEEERAERALELAVEALRRAADSLEGTSGPLHASLDELEAAVNREVMGGYASLAGRASAHRMQGRLLEVRSRMAGVFTALRAKAGPGFERYLQLTRLRWLRLKRAWARSVRRARSLVGAEATGPTTATRTARSLAMAGDLVETLPLVYQHLFTTEPVTDSGLLIGREVELAEVEGKWRHWKEKDGIPLLVTGRRGSGLSSFFNVFAANIVEAGGRIAHDVLNHRVTTEAELALYLAGLLDLESVPTLDALAAEILGAPEGSLPDLIAVEGLEHLYLRVPGGTDLLERLFTLMAETEPRVFWVGSLTSSAWQVVEKAEPAAAAQMDRLDLSALSAADIQAAVLARHRRSGLQLQYQEPDEGRRVLRRRVRRLRGTERHQQVLADDYFDRLHRSSQGNLRLAFFQWLRSVDFSGGESQLVVQPLLALDFSFLDSLDLTQNFTIKAFLEHHTLSLAEHDEIFRVPHEESYHIIESLGNRHIIEAVPRPEDDPAVSEVQADIRYRIRPLLTGAVAGHLASRNIVH